MSHPHHPDLLYGGAASGGGGGKCRGVARTKPKACIVNHVPVAPTITSLFERCPARPAPDLPVCCPTKIDVPVPTIVACLRELCRFDCDKTIALVVRVCTPCPIDCFQVLSDWSATFRLHDKPLHVERGDFTIQSLPLCDNACEFDGHSSACAKRTLLDNQTLPRGDFVLTVSATVDEVAEVDFVSGAVTGVVDGQEVQVGFHVDLCATATNADRCQSGKCLWNKPQPAPPPKYVAPPPPHAAKPSSSSVVVHSNNEQHVHQYVSATASSSASAAASARQRQHQGQHQHQQQQQQQQQHQRHRQHQQQASKHQHGAFAPAQSYRTPAAYLSATRAAAVPPPQPPPHKKKGGCVSCH